MVIRLPRVVQVFGFGSKNFAAVLFCKRHNMSSVTMLAVLALGFVGAETDFPTTLLDDNQGHEGACMFLGCC